MAFAISIGLVLIVSFLVFGSAIQIYNLNKKEESGE